MARSDVVHDGAPVQRRGAWRYRGAVPAGIVAVALLVPLLTWLGVGGGRPTPLLLAAVFVPTAAGVVIGVLVHRFLRRRRPAPVGGGDPATRQAVHRALRSARAPDERIHQLAREAAGRSVGGLRTQQWIYGLLVLIWLILLGLRVDEGDPFDIALAALSLIVFGSALAGSTRQRRRSLHYLREGRLAAPGDPAA